jgi:hypothetical protein
MHGAIDTQTESQQRDHFDNQALAKTLEAEEEKDDSYDDVQIIHFE